MAVELNLLKNVPKMMKVDYAGRYWWMRRDGS
jgi:hypothetical protein